MIALTQLSGRDDAPWVRLLTDFVQRAGYRLREVPTIYKYLLNALPDTSPATLEALRQELLHHFHWRGTRYRAVVVDFLKKTCVREDQVSQVRSQKLTLRYTPGEVATALVKWPVNSGWRQVVSGSVACDVEDKKGDVGWEENGAKGEVNWPRLFLWWRGEMRYVGRFVPRVRHGVRQRRRFDLTRLLPKIRPDEPLSLVVAADADAVPGRLRATLILGVRKGQSGIDDE